MDTYTDWSDRHEVQRTLLYVGFVDGHPFAAECEERGTRRNGQAYVSMVDYNLAPSRRWGGLLYRPVGGGSFPCTVDPGAAPRYTYWLNPAAEAAGQVHLVHYELIGGAWTQMPGPQPGARRLARFPRTYHRDRLFAEAHEHEWVWCETCQDEIPDGDLCAHIWWCERCGWWNTDCDHPPEAEEEADA